MRHFMSQRPPIFCSGSDSWWYIEKEVATSHPMDSVRPSLLLSPCVCIWTLFLELMSDVCSESYNFKEGYFLSLLQGEVREKMVFSAFAWDSNWEEILWGILIFSFSRPEILLGDEWGACGLRGTDFTMSSWTMKAEPQKVCLSPQVVLNWRSLRDGDAWVVPCSHSLFL